MHASEAAHPMGTGTGVLTHQLPVVIAWGLLEQGSGQGFPMLPHDLRRAHTNRQTTLSGKEVRGLAAGSQQSLKGQG